MLIEYCKLESSRKSEVKMTSSNGEEADDDNLQPRSHASDSPVVGLYCKVDADQLPADMLELLAAANEPLPTDCNLPPLPHWLDVEKLKRGQTFALNCMFGLNYSQSLSLLLLFSTPDGLRPLIFTEKSHTPSLAYDRYLSTVLRVKSWYESDIWEPTSEGYKNLTAVRTLHLSVSNRLNKMSARDIRRNTNLESKLKTEDAKPLCPLLNILRTDFNRDRNVCPIFANENEPRVYLNQLEMCFTQFGFYGLMLLHPDKFAAKNATEEDLSGFAHLWRYIGYALGIKEEYNMCRGDIDSVIRRSRRIVEYFIRPSILRVDKEWEHMARCAFQGIEKFTGVNLNFEAVMMYFCWVLDIRTPHLEQYVGWRETILFYLTKFIMTECHKLPVFGRFYNYRVQRNIEQAVLAAAAEKKKSYTGSLQK